MANCPNYNNHICLASTTKKEKGMTNCPWCGLYYVPSSTDEWTPNTVVKEAKQPVTA